ncbi:hypothetical protein [Streptomyces sp. AC550_RSS872]|uniref:hypothetical protein n=1 Tax=Streptomyces sp. AC550_RSS872 TaxID=2823689 RepID=UPI001C272EB4|nr:hypothetical protein [Streptomyces sp. AC550_RSS872]
MNTFANQPPAHAAGGDDLPIFARANTRPVGVYVAALSGDRNLTMAGWLRIGFDAFESKAVAAAWAEFREQLHTDPALNIRRGDTLRARKLAAGQGRPLPLSTRRGPNRAEQWRYRQVLRRGLATIAELPDTTVGTAHGPHTTGGAAARALIERLSARHTADGTSALAVIRRNTVATWYDLAAAPSPTSPESLPCAAADTDGLLEAAEFVAYCAYRHHAQQRNRRFLSGWFAELHPGAEEPLLL